MCEGKLKNMFCNRLFKFIIPAKETKLQRFPVLKQKLTFYLFTLLLLTSCGKVGDIYDNKQVFNMNLDAGLTSLDPAYARDQSTNWMTSQLYNGLVELDGELRIGPSIAKSWEISPDGKTYTFHLRKDVFFHKSPLFGEDGTRSVTASDFKYSFTRICDKSTASSGQWIFNGKVAGLEAFQNEESDQIEGFKVVAPDTFRIELTQPFPPFLSLLAMAYGFVVPQEVVTHYGKEYRNHPIGTGPFRFHRWEEGNFLILHKHDNYFERDAKGTHLPYLDAVYVRFIESRLSAFIEFTQGNLDFVNGLDKSFKDEILTREGEIQEAYKGKYQFMVAPQLNTEYLGIMVDSAFADPTHPLMNVKVRKALNHALDREKMVKFLLNGIGYPANSGFVPNGMPGHDPALVPGFEYNPEKSAQLLEEAGYPGGAGLPVLTLKSTPKYQNIMEFVQKSFEKVGVKVEIESMMGGALREQIYKSQAQLWRASWIADYPDGENYLSLFYSANHAPNGPNTTHFQSARFDSLYLAALAQPNDSLRIPYYQEMDRLMLEQAPIIPLYYDKILRIVSPDIEGLGTNPMNFLYLKRVKKNINLN